MTTCSKCGSIGGRWDTKCRVCEDEGIPVGSDPLFSLATSLARQEACDLLRQSEVLERLLVYHCALKKIAAFGDQAGNFTLETHGSYSRFDEPYSVKIAREALKQFPVATAAASAATAVRGCDSHTINGESRNSDAGNGAHTETAGETASDDASIPRSVETVLPTQPGDAVTYGSGVSENKSLGRESSPAGHGPAPVFIITQQGPTTQWVLCREPEYSTCPFRWMPHFGPLRSETLKLHVQDAADLLRILNLQGCKAELWSEAASGIVAARSGEVA